MQEFDEDAENQPPAGAQSQPLAPATYANGHGHKLPLQVSPPGVMSETLSTAKPHNQNPSRRSSAV